MSYLVNIKTHKLLSIVIASFLFSLFFIGFDKFTFKESTVSSPNLLRNLSNDTLIKQICKLGPTGLLDYYITEEYEPLIKEDTTLNTEYIV